MIRVLSVAFLCCSLVSCASTILTPEERVKLSSSPEHEWRAATLADVPGLYASKEISGPMAAVIWKLYYNFDEGGSYTGAALFAESPPRFEVLSGSWAFTDGRLILDGGEAAETLAVPNALQLSGEAGTVVLEREPEL